MNKCYKCLFAGEYRDMCASTPVCNRGYNLVEAVKEYQKNEPCKWHITKDDIIRLQNEGVIELKPFIPAGTPRAEAREAAQKLIAISKAASDAAQKLSAISKAASDAMAQAITNISKNIENGGKTE